MSDAGPLTIITGASSGIGRRLAKRLAADGEAIAAIARRKELLDSLVMEIEREGGAAVAISCDVTDVEALREAVRVAEARFGPTVRLVANAGASTVTDPDAFTAEHVARTLDLNVLGVANAIEVVLPGMLERGEGHLVAMSSLASYRGLPTAGAYAASKAAVARLMEGLRIDLRPRGIDVTVIAPGFIDLKGPRPGRRKKSRKIRPFKLELAPAVERIARAIRARKPYYAFPRILVAVLWASHLLPYRAFDRLVRGRGPRVKNVKMSKKRVRDEARS